MFSHDLSDKSLKYDKKGKGKVAEVVSLDEEEEDDSYYTEVQCGAKLQEKLDFEDLVDESLPEAARNAKAMFRLARSRALADDIKDDESSMPNLIMRISNLIHFPDEVQLSVSRHTSGPSLTRPLVKNLLNPSALSRDYDRLGLTPITKPDGKFDVAAALRVRKSLARNTALLTERAITLKEQYAEYTPKRLEEASAILEGAGPEVVECKLFH